jgi:hypothetical protein
VVKVCCVDGCRCTETGMLEGLVLDLAGGKEMFFWEVCVFMCWGLLSWNLAGGQRSIFFWVRVRD